MMEPIENMQFYRYPASDYDNEMIRHGSTLPTQPTKNLFIMI